jgi:putative flippase GtrA
MLKSSNETLVADENPKRRHDIKRAGKFGAVGVFNTLLDFIIFNVLSGPFRLGLIEANIISTTVAMSFSFMANKKVVFKKHDGHMGKQAITFLAITAFGLYVLQTGTIHFLTDIWTYPLLLAIDIANLVGFTGHDEFVFKNSAKAAATVVSMTWNYLMYKKVVFR